MGLVPLYKETQESLLPLSFYRVRHSKNKTKNRSVHLQTKKSVSPGTKIGQDQRPKAKTGQDQGQRP